jgi:membrane associated rhomboid family serine protease
MANERRSVVFTLPPFGRWSKRLATAAGALWVMHVVLFFVARPPTLEALPTVKWGALVPMKVTAGYQLWRMLSYALLDLPNSFDGLWSVLMLWWFGTPIERREGVRGILIPWVVGVVGGALGLMALARVSLDFHVSPALGMAPILSSALLVKWGFLHARERVSLFGLAEMDGWVLAAVFCAIGAINALTTRTPIGLASLGAMIAVFGWVGASHRRGDRGGRGGGKRAGSSGAFKVIQGGKRDEKRWVN